jgi:hypothetical protein
VQYVMTCHLALWRYLHGELPEGMTVDHKCKNTRCVEPSHHRLLSRFENGRRQSGQDWPLGECKNGHPNSELRQDKTGRLRCHPCRLDDKARYRARKKAGLTPAKSAN